MASPWKFYLRKQRSESAVGSMKADMNCSRQAANLAEVQIGSSAVTEGQYSIGYLLTEIALIAVALGASRLAFAPAWLGIESQALCFCIATTAACGALGGIFLRMAVGLIVGGVFSVASLPLLWMLLTAGRVAG